MQMRYCINPWCTSRASEDTAEQCSACGTPLLVNNRFILIRPLFDLKRHHFCDVFEALDTQGSWINPANTVMILKVLKGYDDQNKYLSMMEKEAEALQLLNHPGIPKSDLDDFFPINLARGPDELYCLAMSKFEGITLEDWIEQHGRVEQPLALNWLKQIAEILDVVHKGVSDRADGFIHRDIKPSNIIVQPDNTLALIDFGGARQTTNTYYAKVAGRSRELVTQIHSLGYTSPEQIDGKAIPQSDFYALGKTFIRVLTGKEFSDIPRDKNTGKLLWQQYAKHIDKPIREFIEDLTSEAIARRPKDTQEILSFLNETLPQRLKWSRVFRSKLFRFSGLFALVLALVMGFHFGRLFLAQQTYQTGLEQVRLNQLALGRKSFERSLSLHSTEDAHTNLAFLCDRLNDSGCALKHFQQAVQLNPNTYPPYLNLGSHYEDRGDDTNAIATYRKAVEVSNRSATEPLNNLARLLILTGRYAEAKKLLEQALSLKVNESAFSRAISLKNLGWVLFAQKDYNAAQKTLKRAIALESQVASSHCLLAQALEFRKQPANAEWRSCLSIQSEDTANSEYFLWRRTALDRGFPLN
jgi:serine/threonine protein kinase